MKNIWTCKIGECGDGVVPPGGDLPMRKAVKEAYYKLTGEEAVFIFSGWGGELTEGERAVVDNRLPDRMKCDENYRCVNCEAMLSGDCLPNPESKREWYNAGHHICTDGFITSRNPPKGAEPAK